MVASITDEELARVASRLIGVHPWAAVAIEAQTLEQLIARLRAVEAELREAKMMVDVWRASNAAMLVTQVPRMFEQVCCCGGHRCGRGLP